MRPAPLEPHRQARGRATAASVAASARAAAYCRRSLCASRRARRIFNRGTLSKHTTLAAVRHVFGDPGQDLLSETVLSGVGKIEGYGILLANLAYSALHHGGRSDA
jgi:hypothetical protein